MSDALLRVEQLSLSLGNTPVLEGVNLHLVAGEMCALIGPNGAGKSVLLRCLCAELHTHSAIHFKQKPLNAWQAELRARQLAVLPQHSELVFPYTVEEVVALGRYPHASGFDKDKAIVKNALKAMDLEKQSDTFYTQLSGGEKQRCQLARVLAQIWPDNNTQSLLLLDEPCSALDPGHAVLLFEQLQQFCQQGLSVIFVVHDINVASRFAKRIIAMKAGRVIIDGSPDAVFQTELLNTLYDSNGKVFKHPVDNYPVYL